MKILRSAALLTVLLATLHAPVSRAQLLVTEVMSSSGTGGTPDWFELTNTGLTTFTITGLRFDDSSFSFATSVALLGITTLAPGQHGVFIESTDTTTPGSEVPNFRAFWGGAALTGAVGFYQGSGAGVSLSSAGDGVEIFDANGNALTQVSFGAATTGASFVGTSTPGAAGSTFTATSVAGQNGAYNSASTAPLNVGSPTVVPEPGSCALVALGVMATGLAASRAGRRVA